jgi:hypothetical protein
MLDDYVWKVLQKVPRGERSKVINEALLSALSVQRGKEACKRMDALAKRLPVVSMDEIVNWIRRDRRRVRALL